MGMGITSRGGYGVVSKTIMDPSVDPLGCPPELVLLTARNNLEYVYTKIRFSTHGYAPTCKSHCKSDDAWCRSHEQPRAQLKEAAAAAIATATCMHACMPVHAYRFIHTRVLVHACMLLLVRACVRTACVQ